MMFVQYHPLLYVLTRKIHLRCLVSEHGRGAILSSVRLDIHAKEMECSAVSESGRTCCKPSVVRRKRNKKNKKNYERLDSYLNNTVL